jgi:cytosine/adenosine deaminase-related metal-dependent hydrolase
MPVRQVFLEALGFNRDGLESAMGPDVWRAFQRIVQQDSSLSLGAHACYSTSSSVIKEAKDWCNKKNLPFSIHVAENTDEIRFLQDGSGYFRKFLEDLGKWVPQWTPPGTTPIQYLEQLGVLDARTLLVHAVHMTEADWEIVARQKSLICFCPRSNRNLNVGHASIEKALALGIVCALGTDSLASNTDLNLFAEATYVLDHYPQLSSETVLFMLTLGGARALQQEQRFGSIEKGKRAALLSVSLTDSSSPSQLLETIVYKGEKGDWQWANCP